MGFKVEIIEMFLSDSSNMHSAPAMIAEAVTWNTSKRGPSNEEESPTAACSKFARCSIDKRNIP